jgi:23S rRNA (uracil1939-C5)-methyltransferase
MQQQRMLPFKIQSMDSLGQGVSKETDKITFIAKTLPGDKGIARIISERKGVCFAKLQNLEEASKLRIKPICPHFESCPSCHYLHTPYEQELEFKKQNLEKLFYKIPHPDIQVTPAIRRTHYRNRIQLHYHQGKKQLGMIDLKDQSIAPIANCIIGRDAVLEMIHKLYKDDFWLTLAKHEPMQGHVEIYELNGEVGVSWNKPYAQGGFTQVFDEMNQLLRKKLGQWSEKLPTFELLDLFAGNGNLSEKLNYSNRLCVDIYNNVPADNFLSQDLYDDQSLKNVKKKLLVQGARPSVVVLDPPRSGLKNLDQWLEEFKPKQVAYVSCDPHTLVRDIMPLNNYDLTELHLFDFFPSTFHFETLAFLERK